MMECLFLCCFFSLLHAISANTVAVYKYVTQPTKSTKKCNNFSEHNGKCHLYVNFGL